MNKLKIGIIYCCYGNPEYINDCLKPWIELKDELDIKIAAVHGQFKEYHDLGIEDNDINTVVKLGDYFGNGIDFLYIQNPYWNSKEYPEKFQVKDGVYRTEAEIRDKGLQYLLKQNCDIIWLLDNDEFYSVEQIKNIINYINREDNEFITWFSIPFKNYIFDGKQYILGFRPPRIFRTRTPGFITDVYLNRCYYDNDFEYKSESGGVSDYKTFPNKNIPNNVVQIKHLTWLHSNGKLKYEYQMKHFGHCGYRWNYDKNELEFNLDYYKKYNVILPEVFKDEN